MVSWAFLLLAVIGAWLTLNAHRPYRGFGPLSVPTFFAGWLHSELVLHALSLQASIVALAIWLGGLERWPGWLALALTAASWGGMVSLLLLARQTGRTLGAALREGLGDDYKRRLPPPARARLHRHLPWSQLAAPLWFYASEVERIRDLPFAPGDNPRQRLDIYRRRGPNTRAPVLIQVHGGGWLIGDKRQQGVPLMLHLAAQGWVCVSTNYRLSPSATFPDHIIDVKRAIAWVREHIEDYGGDPEFIVITGGSAGGHLCSLAALTANDPSLQPGFEDVDTSVRACVPFYGVYDFTNGGGHMPSRGMGLVWVLERFVLKRSLVTDRAAFERASPLWRVNERAPPFFVIHGDRDNLVPVEDARRFVTSLRETSRAPVVYAELDGAHHAFDVFYSPRTQQVIRGVDRFLSWVYGEHLRARSARR